MQATGIFLNAKSAAFNGVAPGYYTLDSFLNAPVPTPTTPDAVHWLWNNSDIADLNNNPFVGVGRSTLRANRWNNLDASIFKNMKFRERYNVQLQFSAYNVLNHRQLGTNDPELDDTTSFWDSRYNYGVRNSARQVQIGARITF